MVIKKEIIDNYVKNKRIQFEVDKIHDNVNYAPVLLYTREFDSQLERKVKKECLATNNKNISDEERSAILYYLAEERIVDLYKTSGKLVEVFVRSDEDFPDKKYYVLGKYIDNGKEFNAVLWLPSNIINNIINNI